jgi:ABC-type phosphate transport system substrate-binding protein
MLRRLRAICALTTALALMGLVPQQPASATTYALIQGSGSTSAANMVNQWVASVAAEDIRVVYTANSSEYGRRNYANHSTDFGVSELPYAGGADASDRPYAYVPLVASGVAIAYNLEVEGRRVANLRLPGETLARIFTGQITSWDDPAIMADNNGRILPPTPITPVVRADASGDTQTLTEYLAEQFPSIWAPCNGVPTAYFPLHCGGATGSDVAMSGVEGVMNRVKSTDGTIGYIGNGYTLMMANVPVAAVENVAGNFIRPEGYGVTVGLGNPTDPRAYPLSRYESAIVPTSLSDSRMTTAKRQTLVDFLSYAVCEGQLYATGWMGYAPLPRSLVTEAFGQIAEAAAGDADVDLAGRDPGTCGTPDYDQDAPMPEACQKRGAGPCGTFGPPVNTQVPAVDGIARVGASVDASTGSWDGADTFAYRWLADGVPIAGATDPTYRIPSSLLGRSLSVEVTGSVDEFPSRTVRSGGVRVAPGRLSGSALAIAGRPIVGRTLAVRGARIAGAQIRVQWYAAGRKIRGATSLRWTLRRAQVGKRVSVRVEASATAYQTFVRRSLRTTKVVRRR